MTEEVMDGCHHWLDGHELEQAPGIDDGQGSLACCSPWDCKESDSTERLNWIVTSLVYGYGRKYSISHCFGKENWRQEKWVTEDEMIGWHHWLDRHELSKLPELVLDSEAWHVVFHGVTKSQTQLSNWSELIWHLVSHSARIEPCAAAAAEFQHLQKGVQRGEQKWGTLCPGKNWQNRSSDIFRSQFYEPKSCISSYL